MIRNAVRLAAVALVASAAVAQAQAPVRPVFGVAAGATMPQGTLGDVVGTGYHVAGLLGFRVPVMPVDLRAELAYTSLSSSIDGVDGKINTINLGVNALYRFPGVAIRPYVTGGLGMYRSSGSDAFDTGDASTDLGLNGGAGLNFKLAGFDTFLEARYTHIMTEDEATKVIPISFGIAF